MGGATGGGGRGGTTGSGGATAGSGGRGGAAGGGGRGGTTGGAGAGGTTGAGGGASTYNPCPTNGDPCKVLPLGDSITFGINYEGSYRVELFKKAVTANQKITFVGTQSNGPATAPGSTVPFPKNHEGHSGWTISMIQGVASMDVQYAPHMILLHAGTNDTYMGDPSGRAGAPVDRRRRAHDHVPERVAGRREDHSLSEPDRQREPDQPDAFPPWFRRRSPRASTSR